MAWSLLNTITPSTNADNHTMFTYLFDTAMQGRGGWTVAAHPDASAFKRKYSITLPNPNRDGANDTRHYWVNWSTTSPTTLFIYGDATYTTVPGDLCTYTTYVSSQGNFGNVVSNNYGSYRFWTSDVSPGALLVTAGKRLVFFWPGWTEWALPLKGADTWDGTKGPAGMAWPHPAIGSGNYGLTVFGYIGSDNSASPFYAHPWFGDNYTLMTGAFPNPTLFKAPPYLYVSNGSQPGPSTYVLAAGSSDVYGWFPGSSYNGNSNYRYIGSLSLTGQVVQDTNTSRYYYVTSASSAHMSMAFDMGLSEPDMS